MDAGCDGHRRCKLQSLVLRTRSGSRPSSTTASSSCCSGPCSAKCPLSRSQQRTFFNTGIRARSSPVQANREKSLLSAVFTTAIEWGAAEQSPCKQVPRLHEQKRERCIAETGFQSVRALCFTDDANWNGSGAAHRPATWRTLGLLRPDARCLQPSVSSSSA